MKKMNEEKLAKMAEYIKDYIEKYGDSPKFSQILEYMDMSNSVGYRYLMTLRDRGIIVYSGKPCALFYPKTRILYFGKSNIVLNCIAKEEIILWHVCTKSS